MSNDPIYDRFSKNPMSYGIWYFQNHFRMEGSPFHLKLLQVAADESVKRLACAAPRESSKSTLLSFLFSSWGIAFKKFRFILNVQNTFNKSVSSLEAIKEEFKINERLKRDFGVELKKDREGDTIFHHPDGFETRVLSKGADQIGSVRGEKFGAYRPDLIVVDDLEDDELVKNPERRNDLQRLYDEALIPAGDANNLKVIVIGTILHDDSQMAKLVSRDYYPEYRKLKFRARIEKDKEYFSLWPEKWSVERLNQLEKEKPNVFAKEYQNDPVSGMMSTFKREDFRYWRVQDGDYVLLDEEGGVVGRGALSSCVGAIACDLALEERRTSDFTVVMPGYLTPNSEILIEDYFCKKGVMPDELEHILFPMEERMRKLTGSVIPVGFEKAKIEKIARHLLKQAMVRRNHFLVLKDLMWDGDKVTRMTTRLQPRYAQHVIFHKKGMGDLEEQLIRIPSGVHDDIPDAEQGLVQLLQYPKAKKKEEKPVDNFDWWRKQSAGYREKNKRSYIFGEKKREPLFKVVQCPPN